MEELSLSQSQMNSNNDETPGTPVIQTEFLETLLKQQHLPEEEAKIPPGTTSFLDEDEKGKEEENPLLNEAEKEVNPPDLLPVFLIGGAVLFAGGYLIYKYWPCSSPVSEVVTEAMTTP